MVSGLRKVFYLSLILFISLVSFSHCLADDYKCFVIPVKGPVEPGLTAFLKRALSEASAQKAACVILEIDTLGGRVDSAVNIRDLIIEADIPNKVAFINKRAISAGALIALSAKEIYVKPMATIGAAKPVLAGTGSEMKAADEKVVSYLRSEFKATAEKNEHPIDIAEAFVDQDKEIEGVTKEGKLLTLTATEAVTYKLAADKVDNMDSLLVKLGLGGESYKEVIPSWSEKMVRFLTHPSVSGILMVIGMLGIFTELKTPGLGFPGLIGALALALFFFAQHLAGLADHVEILLFLVGVILLSLEIFVIPGFGVCGILGISGILGSLFLSLIGTTVPEIPVSFMQIEQAFYTMVFVLAGILVGGYVVFKYIFPTLVFSSPLVLDDHLESGINPDKEQEDILVVGMIGKSITPLHPTGKAIFDNKMVDVFSDGDFLDEGVEVKIVEVAGNRVKVCKN